MATFFIQGYSFKESMIADKSRDLRVVGSDIQQLHLCDSFLDPEIKLEFLLLVETIICRHFLAYNFDRVRCLYYLLFKETLFKIVTHLPTESNS